MKRDFTKWFQEKLRVERYPMPGEVARLPKESHVLNVSDEYIWACAAEANRHNVYYHWLPFNECVGSMGFNSLFGALVILHEAEARDEPVLLHCHAGANRSQTVADAYYYLRTGRHYERVLSSMQRVLVNFADNLYPTPLDKRESLEIAPNMLQWNCSTGQLPQLPVTEKFLKLLGTRLEETMDFAACRGGLLTDLKKDLNIT